MHFIVGLADISGTALRTWDLYLLYDDRPIGSLAHGG